MSSSTESNRNNFDDDRATAERAAAAVRIIASALDTMGEAGSLTAPSNVSPRVFALAYGWLAFVVRTTQLIALAHEHGLRHECAASSRVVLQHSLALQSGNAHPSYASARAYLVPETGESSVIAVNDTYVYLIDSVRCAIQAGHAFAALLGGTFLAGEVAQAAAASTARRHRTILANAMDYAIELGLLEANPIRALKWTQGLQPGGP